MDLDALLDDAANSMLDAPKAVAVVKAPVQATPAEIKPWLASSANVPKDTREKMDEIMSK